MRLIAEVLLEGGSREFLAAMVADFNRQIDNSVQEAQDGANPDEGDASTSPATEKTIISFPSHWSWTTIKERLATEDDLGILLFYSPCHAYVENHILLGTDPEAAVCDWINQATEMIAFLRDHRAVALVINAHSALADPHAFYSLIADKCRLDVSIATAEQSTHENTPMLIGSFLAQLAEDENSRVRALQKELNTFDGLHSSDTNKAPMPSIAPLITEYQSVLNELKPARRANDALARAEADNNKIISRYKSALNMAEEYFARSIASESSLADVTRRLAAAQAENRAIAAAEKKAEKKYNAAIQELNATHKSVSWRITKPIRIIRKMLQSFSSSRDLREQIELVRGSRLFDSEWYLEKNPDIRSTRLDPIEHFIRYGGFEGRSPGPKFSTKAYLQNNPRLVGAGLNPLVHFLREESSGKPPLSQSEDH